MAQRGREKRAACAAFVAGTGNFAVKPGLDISVFHKALMSSALSGKLHEYFIF
jgi:hypothetical protein